jgi:hypothetical protein
VVVLGSLPRLCRMGEGDVFLLLQNMGSIPCVFVELPVDTLTCRYTGKPGLSGAEHCGGAK